MTDIFSYIIVPTTVSDEAISPGGTPTVSDCCGTASTRLETGYPFHKMLMSHVERRYGGSSMCGLHLCSKPEIEFVSRVGYRNDVDSVVDRYRIWSDFVRQMRHFFRMPMAATPHYNFVTSEATQFWKRRPSVGYRTTRGKRRLFSVVVRT